MKTKRWFLVGVICAWQFCSAVQGQPAPSRSYAPPLPIPVNGDAPVPNGNPAPFFGGLSDWILYRGDAPAVKRDCCEGPLGMHTPLYTELYLRAGPSMPIGGETLSRELKTGWSIMGGTRALIFNEPMTRAWTVDFHIINTNESGGQLHTRFPLSLAIGNATVHFGAGGIPGITVQASNRTSAGVGLGREYYLWSSANSDGNKWRVGFDGGGRWGSHNLVPDETRHTTDVIASAFVSLHSDLEIPTRFGIFFYGTRLEWAYTWSDVLQQPSNVQDLTVMINGGIRF